MAKVIKFIELELINFTSHRNLKFEYGEITKLSGMNGQGKTSIGTAPIWILYGTDLWGKTFNPSPSNYEFDRVFASIILSVDGVEMKFARELVDGKAAYYINDVPSKATEFNDTVASLFDKDEFLSLYNPSYFFTLHWTKQREQIMKYTTAPAKQEVLKHLPEPQADKLNELTKKHNLDQLQSLHRDQKNKLEKSHIAAESRTKTLQEQLELLGNETIDIEVAKGEVERLTSEIKEVEEKHNKSKRISLQIASLNKEFDMLVNTVRSIKEEFRLFESKPIKDTCSTCGQKLEGEAKELAEKEHESRRSSIVTKHNEAAEKAKSIKSELEVLRKNELDDSDDGKMQECMAKRDELKESIRNYEEKERLSSEVEKAKRAEADTLTSLRESIFILDAIKAYRAKEAELQAEKVQSLFTTLSIRLFKHIKSTNEYEPDFSVQMDNKDYVQLSAGEKIAAGLELTEVLFKQSELITPTFIDGIGEYTGKVAVYGQLITGRAVADQKLKIETEDAA